MTTASCHELKMSRMVALPCACPLHSDLSRSGRLADASTATGTCRGRLRIAPDPAPPRQPPPGERPQPFYGYPITAVYDLHASTSLLHRCHHLHLLSICCSCMTSSEPCYSRPAATASLSALFNTPSSQSPAGLVAPIAVSEATTSLNLRTAISLPQSMPINLLESADHPHRSPLTIPSSPASGSPPHHVLRTPPHRPPQ